MSLGRRLNFFQLMFLLFAAMCCMLHNDVHTVEVEVFVKKRKSNTGQTDIVVKNEF